MFAIFYYVLHNHIKYVIFVHISSSYRKISIPKKLGAFNEIPFPKNPDDSVTFCISLSVLEMVFKNI